MTKSVVRRFNPSPISKCTVRFYLTRDRIELIRSSRWHITYVKPSCGRDFRKPFRLCGIFSDSKFNGFTIGSLSITTNVRWRKRRPRNSESTDSMIKNGQKRFFNAKTSDKISHRRIECHNYLIKSDRRRFSTRSTRKRNLTFKMHTSTMVAVFYTRPLSFNRSLKKKKKKNVHRIRSVNGTAAHNSRSPIKNR